MERIDYKEVAFEIINIMQDKKADNIIAYDVSKMTSFTDYIIIATVGSSVQLKAISKELKKEVSIKSDHVEGFETGGWLLMDYDGVIINLFLAETREFYSLERIWGGAEQLKV